MNSLMKRLISRQSKALSMLYLTIYGNICILMELLDIFSNCNAVYNVYKDVFSMHNTNMFLYPYSADG